jgi:hypothetical protein
MAAILFKVTLAVATSLLAAWVLRTRLVELSERRFLTGALALQLGPAVGLFVALYVVGHGEPTSDVPSFYVPAARATLAGQVPFRDFALSYAPLFAYVGAALVWLWNSGKSFALFATVMNAAALLCWHRAASTQFDVTTARHSTLLYATSGHVLVQTLLGTNQVWVSAGLAASALLMARGRDGGSGFVQALTACSTKILAHLFWPVLWICAPRRARWLATALLPTVLLYGVFVTVGAGDGLLYPLRYEGELISPGNLPYMLDLVPLVSGSLERLIFDGLALAVLGIATVWLYVRARAMSDRERQRLLFAGLALTGLLFMLFSKKSFTGYVVFVMYPAIVMLVTGVTDTRARIGFLLVFNTLLAAEPSLWFHLGGNMVTLRAWFVAGGGAKAAGFVLVDAALLACYVYLAWLSIRRIEKTTAGVIAAPVGITPAAVP